MTENNHSRYTPLDTLRSVRPTPKIRGAPRVFASSNAWRFAPLFCGSGGQVAGGANVEFDGVFHTQDEGAGVLESPFLVGNREVGGRGGLRACYLDGEGKGEVVVLPVEPECAGDFQLR